MLRALLTTVAVAVFLSGCGSQPSSSDANADNEPVPAAQSNSPTQNEPSTPPKTQTEIQPADDKEEQEQDVSFESVILFELTDEDLSKPETEIPYYTFGNIGFVTQEEIQGFSNGSYPWRGDSVQAASILTQNLIPEGMSADQVEYKAVPVENQSQADETTVVDMIVPSLGTFTIHLQHPNKAVFSYITKMVWQPESSKALQQLEGSVTLLDLDESWFDKLTSKIPAFGKGNIRYFEQEAVDSFNQGHSVPWGDPRVQAMLAISELVPYDYLQDEAISQQLSDRKEILTTSNGIVFTPQYESFQDRPVVVQVEVPDFGVYTVTLNSGTDSSIAIVQKVEFEAGK
ncbi:hypothetical protein PA598K_02757 [Paenibacillus sp. 598K]|nr:hypothetical protein PA598K_02757 [Paenibacillus sp. 598K]